MLKKNNFNSDDLFATVSFGGGGGGGGGGGSNQSGNGQCAAYQYDSNGTGMVDSVHDSKTGERISSGDVDVSGLDKCYQYSGK